MVKTLVLLRQRCIPEITVAMAKIYTNQEDEVLIDLVQRKGLCALGGPKWAVLRLALALSLRLPTEPDEALDRNISGGKEYDFEQLTGEGHKRDFTDAFRALLSVYHQTDLFNEPERFRILLQRHVRRGLREMRASWSESHDFHEYLYQELFSDIAPAKQDIREGLRQHLANALQEIGIEAEIRDEIEGARLNRFYVFLPNVNDLDRLRRGLDKISFYLGLSQQRVFESPTDEPRIIGLDVPRPPNTWHHFSGNDLREWVRHSPEGYELPVWPGVDVLGKPVCFDLAQAPHLLVGGTTGSGKSVCLHALLLSLLHTKTPEELRVCLIDPKHVEFSTYKNLRNLYLGEVMTESEAAFKALNELVVEMMAREQQLAEMSVRNLEEAGKMGRVNLPRIVVFVEELADLFMQNEETEGPLVRLAQKARAVGIHLVLATQRPDSSTFSGLLRSNVPSRIALTVQKSSESKIIIDEVGAERLMGKGDMLIKFLGIELQRIHGVHIGRDDIAASLKIIANRG